MIIDPQKIIINKRGFQSRGEVLLSVVLPLSFCAGLLYLVRPLAVLIGWSAAAMVVDAAARSPELAELPASLLSRYLPLIIGFSFSLFCWALYNRLRFSGSGDQRRATPPAVGLEEIASDSPFGVEVARRIRGAQVLFFFFDDKGAIVGVKCRKADSDTDYTLAQATALAPAVAAGLGLPESSGAARPIPEAPRARPLRPVPAGSEGIALRAFSSPARVMVKHYSGGFSPGL